MPQTASRSIDESALTKMQLRKLNALRKSVGHVEPPRRGRMGNPRGRRRPAMA